MQTITIQRLDDMFVFIPPSRGGVYLINGERLEIQKEEYILTTEPKTIEKVTKESVESHWENGEGQVMTLEEFDKKVKELTINARYSDHCYVFPDLDEEFKYKKFKQGWIKQRKYVEKNEKLEIQFVDLIRSENEYIVPMWSLGKLSDPLCKYVPNATKLFREIAKELGFKEVLSDKPGPMEISIPTHGNLDFAKTNEKYIYGSSNGPYIGQKIDTYENCLKRHNEFAQSIREDLLLHRDLVKLEGKAVDASQFLDDLRVILTKVHALEVYTKNRDRKMFAINKINETIKKLRNTVEQD